MLKMNWKPDPPQSESDRCGSLLLIPSQGIPKNVKIFQKPSQVWLELFWLNDVRCAGDGRATQNLHFLDEHDWLGKAGNRVVVNFPFS